MRFTVILVVLCAIAMVTLAARSQKGKRMKKRMMKAEKQRQAQCEVITWGECTDGKITQTVSSNTSNPNCPDGLVDAESATMDCITSHTKTLGRGCKMTVVYNFTDCQNNGEVFSVEKTFDCRDKITTTKPCSMNFAVKAKKLGKLKQKMGKMDKKLKKQKKAFRQELRDLKSKGCVYKPTRCDPTTKEQKWTLKQGDQATCKPELVKPCIGGKMKKNHKKGGKMKKNKTAKRRRQRGGNQRA